jgi:hypothetical protein
MDNDGNAVRFAARNANSNAYRAGHKQSRPIILEIDAKGVRTSYLEPDVDARTHDWKQSLWKMGSVGYRGVIPPQFIKLHMMWDDEKKEWVKV